MAAEPDPYSFSDLLHYSRSELRAELCTIIGELCTSIEHTAFLRATDGKGMEYYESEGRRDALVERKWLIYRLMDTLDE